MQRIVTGVVVSATVAGAVLVMLWAVQRKLIYFPTQAVPPLGLVTGNIEEVSFPTRDGLTLSAWIVLPDGEAGDTVVVVFPGNGGNRADRVPMAKSIAAVGHSVLLVDYRGYGGNPGSPFEDGLLEDARASVEYLSSRQDVDSDRVVYFGESLGAAVAVALAQQLPPAGLILRSPFTSLADVAAVHYPYLPTRLLLRDRYPSIDRIGGIEVPVLVIAGSGDTIIPIAQSREIYDAAPGPKRFVVIEAADHNDLELVVGDRVIAEVADFLDTLP